MGTSSEHTVVVSLSAWMVWGNDTQQPPSKWDIGRMHRVQDYLEENMPKFNLQIEGYHWFTQVPKWDSTSISLDIRVPLLRRYMKMLQEESSSLEQLLDGRTPLLHHSGQGGSGSLAMVQVLLEHGADVHATDPYGNNAIHMALRSNDNNKFQERRKSSVLLEQKLTFLIEAGADIHHRNHRRLTPSWYAHEYECWDEWCAALARNGLDIEEVMKNESSYGSAGVSTDDTEALT